MKTRALTLAVTSALLGMTAQVQAAGFQLAETSATGLGRAFAGEAAMADNASAQARNPAMLSYLEGTQVSGGVIYVRPDIDVTGDIHVLVMKENASAYDVADSAYIPNFYISHQLNDKFTLGLALNSNYGLSTGIAADHNAALFGNKTSVKTIEFNPNIAYKLNNNITFGAGLRVVHGKGEIMGSTPKLASLLKKIETDSKKQKLIPDPGTTLKHLKGEDYGFGWQIGTSWQINPANRIGLAYHSKVDLNLDGHASGFLYGNQEFSGYIPLELPAFAELSTYHQITNKWAIHSSINWTDWSSFDELRVHFTSNNRPKETDQIKQENFRDNWRFALGTTYHLNQKVTLRGGMALDKTAVSNAHRTTTIPDSDRLWFSMGMGYQITKQLDIDLGLTYIKSIGDAAISENILLKPTTVVASFQGEASGNVVLAGIQMNYKF